MQNYQQPQWNNYAVSPPQQSFGDPNSQGQYPQQPVYYPPNYNDPGMFISPPAYPPAELAPGFISNVFDVLEKSSQNPVFVSSPDPNPTRDVMMPNQYYDYNATNTNYGLHSANNLNPNVSPVTNQNPTVWASSPSSESQLQTSPPPPLTANSITDVAIDVPLGTPVYIISKHTGYVLEVKSGNLSSGTPIVMAEKKVGEDSQMFVYTQEGFLEVKNNSNFVLALEHNGSSKGSRLVIHSKHTYANENQKWTFDNGRIRSRSNNLVLDVKAGSVSKGVQVILWPKKYEDFENQVFTWSS
eukprot:TRINITY_DN18690_c0_g1_i1.p1 TRINITY_DN18690_c0_g1~~TRINITY_DN18690_c0_g1_i1.p1  ORF type:complete len:311 (-),score=43.83 TRINITY_DN18690_c0_g1_i1:60-956(-)